jgi:CysZ protein
MSNQPPPPMELFITAALRSIKSIFVPGMFGVFMLSIALTIAALIGFITGSSMFFSWLGSNMQDTLMGYILGWLGVVGSFMLAWILFPGMMPIIVNFFDERIALLIERHDYPAAPPLRANDFWKELRHDLRFSLKAIALNILVLPLYLVPIINLFLFYLLNGYLLGREFFVMAAIRHVPREEAEALRMRHSRIIMCAGIVLTILATIPIINLFAPFWGVAVMVHLFHTLTHTPNAELLSPPQ